MTHPQFPFLFSPLQVRGLELANRIVMPAMGNRYPTFSGKVTDRLVRYYEDRAKGGTGLIIVQFACVTSAGRSSHYPLGIWDDDQIPGLRRLVDTVHSAGVPVAIQLAHVGAMGDPAITGQQPAGPSPVPCVGRVMPRELSTSDLSTLGEAFAVAAGRAVEAGFDAIEVHMAHGYLLQQFLSPLSNRRTDDYGGDFERRLRFPLQVLEGVRRAIGEGRTIICRLCVDEAVPGGLELSSGVGIAGALEKAGADVISVTAGRAESFHVSVPSEIPPNDILPSLAGVIRQAVHVPVMAVGMLHDPVLMERILKDGIADLVAVGRGLIADPDLPRRAFAGQLHEIRPCLACASPECHGRVFRQLGMGCVVNPAVGREQECELRQASRPRRVVVVGGGPAGLEAARTLAARGHSVVLFERGQQLGGQLLIAGQAPNKGLLLRQLSYFERQLEGKGVDIRLQTEADTVSVLRASPDAVVVATGATPLIPEIDGIGPSPVTAWDVLAGKEVGRCVAIIGGGVVGCNVAEYLAVRGHRVTILEMLSEPAIELAAWNRHPYTERLVSLGIEFLLNARVNSVNGQAITYDQMGYLSRVDGFESVVVAAGAAPYDRLSSDLRANGIETLSVGDCRKPRNAAAAIREGFEAALSL